RWSNAGPTPSKPRSTSARRSTTRRGCPSSSWSACGARRGTSSGRIERPPAAASARGRGLLPERAPHPLRSGRDLAEPHPRRVVDGGRARGGHADDGRLAEPFRAVGTPRELVLHQDGLDVRRVERGGNDVGGELVVEDAAIAHRVLLDQRIAEPLDDAALHLAF